MPEKLRMDPEPGKPVGSKARIPAWMDGNVGPFGNWSAQPQMKWRFKIDFDMAYGLEKYYSTVKPLVVLNDFVKSDLMARGHGRWQSLEVKQAVNGEVATWNVGTLDVSYVEYKKAPVTLTLTAVETTSLWVKKLAILLRDCAVDADTGFYRPFNCRFPLNIFLTTYGFKDGYSRLVVYRQCGIVKDEDYMMDQDDNENLENKISLICKDVEFSNFENGSYKDVLHKEFADAGD